MLTHDEAAHPLGKAQATLHPLPGPRIYYNTTRYPPNEQLKYHTQVSRGLPHTTRTLQTQVGCKSLIVSGHTLPFFIGYLSTGLDVW